MLRRPSKPYTTAQESFDASRAHRRSWRTRLRVVITRQNSSWLRNINTRKNARDAWTKVREIIGKKAIHDAPGADGITVQVLNNHYAAVSRDRSYRESAPKQTASSLCHCITEIEVFHILHRLRPTATGFDDIPAWFLRLRAPIFAALIAQLINQSVTAGVVPNQWKRAIINQCPRSANRCNRATSGQSQ